MSSTLEALLLLVGWLTPEEVSAHVVKQPWWGALERDLENRPASSQLGFPGGASSKEPSANAGDIRDGSSIPGLGRFPGGGHGNPLQYSCLENPMNRGAWQATVHRLQRVGHNWSNWAQHSTHWNTNISLWLWFQLFWIYTHNCIAVPYDNTIFHFLRNHHIVLENSYT